MTKGKPFHRAVSAMIADTVEKGVGKTLQGIALLVGLGSMFGGILELSVNHKKSGCEKLVLCSLHERCVE